LRWSCSEVSARRCGSGEARHEVRSRTLGYVACLIIEQTGAAILIFGHTSGLYAVGVGMMASFLFNVSGAWLLLVGVDSLAESSMP
jgi:hypothetical protein